jgi:hypothetical protein
MLLHPNHPTPRNLSTQKKTQKKRKKKRKNAGPVFGP